MMIVLIGLAVLCFGVCCTLLIVTQRALASKRKRQPQSSGEITLPVEVVGQPWRRTASPPRDAFTSPIAEAA